MRMLMEQKQSQFLVILPLLWLLQFIQLMKCMQTILKLK